MDWKGTVVAVSDRVFSGLSHKPDESYNIENEVLSSLPLQMSLYFNVIFAPMWTLIIILFLKDKFDCYDELIKVTLLLIITTVFIVEITRLYLGYEGNLKDKIPELAGFWILSGFLQLPLQGFLLFNPYFNLNVAEIVAQSVMFVTLVVELISGYRSLKFISQRHTIYFSIMKLKRRVTMQDIRERYRCT